jgi:O-antigen/teichoic acid export membrane protein
MLARAYLLNLGARLTSGAAALGLAVITTNVLDTHGRGVYAILGTGAGICVTIITGGTPVLAADLIHGRHEERVLHGAVSAIAAGSGLLLAALSLVIWGLTDGVALAALLYTAAVATFVIYSNFEMAVAQARGDVLRVSLTDIGMALFPLVATAAAAVIFEPTVTVLVGGWAAGALVTAVALFAYSLPNGSLMIRRSWRVGVSVTRRAAGVALANGLGLLYARIDVLVVAAVISVSAAGVYSIAVALSTGLLLLSRSLLTATYHSIMTAPVTEVAARLSTAVRHSVIIVLAGRALSVPVVAFTGSLVFGEAYGAVWQPYAILVVASAFNCVHEPLRHFLLTRIERRREFLLIQAGMLLVNGVLAVVGAAEFGLLGAAASTAITYGCDATALVAVSARALSVPMRRLAVPRRSDFVSYWRAARSLLVRPGSAARW